MNDRDLQPYEADILERLMKAGPGGLGKSDLRIIRNGIREKALAKLVHEGKAASFRVNRRLTYAIASPNDPSQNVMDQILENAALFKSILVLKAELLAGVCGRSTRELDEAVDNLLADGRLAALPRSTAVYFASAQRLADLLRSGSSEKRVSNKILLEKEQVLDAYLRTSRRLGFVNIEIYELQQETGASMDELKTFLSYACEKGWATLSLGDWSLSSKEIRSGAIEVRGRPHLFVRFDTDEI